MARRNWKVRMYRILDGVHTNPSLVRERIYTKKEVQAFCTGLSVMHDGCFLNLLPEDTWSSQRATTIQRSHDGARYFILTERVRDGS